MSVGFPALPVLPGMGRKSFDECIRSTGSLIVIEIKYMVIVALTTGLAQEALVNGAWSSKEETGLKVQI